MKEYYIREIIKFITQKYPHNEEMNIGKNDLLFEKGIIDSLGVVELVTFLEVRFGVSFEEQDLTKENLMSVEVIANLLEKKLTKR